MLRLLAVALLLASASGCMMVDDMIYGEPMPVPAWSETPAHGCGVAPANFNAGQTAEPELLRR